MCIRNLLYLLCTLLLQLCQPWRRKALFLGGHKISLRFRVGMSPQNNQKPPPTSSPHLHLPLNLLEIPNSTSASHPTPTVAQAVPSPNSRRAHLSNGGQEQIARNFSCTILFPFFWGYDILMDHFNFLWFKNVHITTFFKSTFQVNFSKKLHPYFGASSTPSARRIPAPPGHAEPPVSRLPRPPNA